MAVEKISKQLLRLALPSILANITVPLVGMVDMVVAGHLDSNSAILIGGISIGTMLFDLLYWNFGFLRVSTGGLAAQAYGRDDKRSCTDILSRSLGTALLISLLLLAVQWVFARFAFLFVDCSDGVRHFAEQYFFIRIWAAPATLSLMSLKGWFIGMQDSVSSMATDLTVNVVNIVLSFILSLGFEPLNIKAMGYPGIALSTVIAQYSGFLVAVFIIVLKYRTVIPEGYVLKDAVKSMSGFEGLQFFTMNKDLFIRSLCFIGIYIGYTLISASFGDVLLATCAILMKLMMFFSYFTDGFAYAGEALCGKSIGSGDKNSFRSSVKWSFIWSCACALFFVLSYAFFSHPILSAMTEDKSVVNASEAYLAWLMLMPLTGVFAFTWDGIFVGATAFREIRNAMLLATAAFFITWFVGSRFVSVPVNCVHVLMAAYFAHLLARDIYLTVKYGSLVGKTFRE